MLDNNKKRVCDYLQFFADNDPDRTAIIFKDNTMTYKEVNEYSNCIANMLIESGIGPDDIVGIIMKRSFEMVISILGVLKSGAAYLPIDPSHPKQRIDYYISNSNAKIILTDTNENDYCSENVRIIDLNDPDGIISYSNKTPSIKTSDNDIAYVIYTSGSTGTPNGVMIEHRTLKNRLLWHINNFNMDDTDVILQKTSYSFDVSVWELLCWCIVGGKLVLIEHGQEKNPRKIIKLIEKHNVTMLHFVPSVLELFLECIENKKDLSIISSIRYIISSGEELSAKTALRINDLLRQNGTSLWNLYGPTEATIDVTAYCCDDLKNDDTKVPIGYAIDNVNLIVLDENLKKCALNEKGELYIGGIAPARGYINNLDLTKKRFIVNPYNKDEIIYKTGDQVFINEKNQFMYCGRFDYQIKLRGLRIELGEIERGLLSIEGINKAVVLVDDRSQSNKHLVAFYYGDPSIEHETITSGLRQKLPEYMLPDRIIHIDTIPLTVNGKTDRKKLLSLL